MAYVIAFRPPAKLGVSVVSFREQDVSSMSCTELTSKVTADLYSQTILADGPCP